MKILVPLGIIVIGVVVWKVHKFLKQPEKLDDPTEEAFRNIYKMFKRK